MKRSKLIIWIFSALAVAIVVFKFYPGKDAGEIPEWATTTVEKGNMAINITASGSLSALTTVEVGTQLSGVISAIYADFNSVVSEGQVIARLDTSLLSATYEEAHAMLQKAMIQRDELKKEYERDKELFDKNAITRTQFDLTSSNFASAAASVKSAEAQLKKAALNRQYAIIKAPISGVVISRNVGVGQTVLASLNSPVLFTIANDLGKMLLYANVDEADIGQVRPGQDVEFTVDAFPGEHFTGKVKQIRLQSVIIQNVVTYTVVIDVPNPEMKLLPGMTANISFRVLEHDNVLKVQSAALHFTPSDEFLEKEKYTESQVTFAKRMQGKNKVSGDSACIWLLSENKLHPVPVQIGIMQNGYAEITGNLKEGDVPVIKLLKEEKNSGRSPFMPSFNPKKKK